MGITGSPERLPARTANDWHPKGIVQAIWTTDMVEQRCDRKPSALRYLAQSRPSLTHGEERRGDGYAEFLLGMLEHADRQARGIAQAQQVCYRGRNAMAAARRLKTVGGVKGLSSARSLHAASPSQQLRNELSPSHVPANSVGCDAAWVLRLY